VNTHDNAPASSRGPNSGDLATHENISSAQPVRIEEADEVHLLIIGAKNADSSIETHSGPVAPSIALTYASSGPRDAGIDGASQTDRVLPALLRERSGRRISNS
jgi:hypothetical protein